MSGPRSRRPLPRIDLNRLATPRGDARGAASSERTPGSPGTPGTPGSPGDRYIGAQPGREELILLGGRLGLAGEKVITQIEETLQLTNYRVVLWPASARCIPDLACLRGAPVDAWVKDISCVAVVKEEFPPMLMAIGGVLILGGVVNYEKMGLHVSDSYQLGFEAAPIVFYLIGLAVLLTGQLLRRTMMHLGVVGRADIRSFQVPIKRSDVFMVTELSNRIRAIQAPYSILRYTH